MITSIWVTITKELGLESAITLSGMIDIGPEQLAGALRRAVATHYGQDDAGCDYFYDDAVGIVCIGANPEWVASREPKHILCMKLADMLDGYDFSFDSTQPVEE